MIAAIQNSSDALCAKILAQAKSESEEILRRAKGEAQDTLTAATKEADNIRREEREAAETEAARRKDLILATVAVEAVRLWATHTEAFLESLRHEISQRLQPTEIKARETIVTLAAAAIREMTGNDFKVMISAQAQAAHGDGLAGEITQRTGRTPLNLLILADTNTTDGGVVVRDADGFQFWDNRLSSRLERIWPELRRQIAIQTSLAGTNHASGGGP